MYGANFFQIVKQYHQICNLSDFGVLSKNYKVNLEQDNARPNKANLTKMTISDLSWRGYFNIHSIF